MATNYPTGLDTFVNPTPTSDTATVSHSSQHTNINDAVLALENKVGITGSAVNTTVDYKLANVTGGDRAVGASQTVSLLNKTLSTATKILIGSDATGDIYYNGGSGILTRLGIGSTGQILTSNGSIPIWTSPIATNTGYAVSTGSANAYVVTLSPALAAYSAGVLIQFKANFTNTGSATVNVNGLGAITMVKPNGQTLSANDIVSGQIVELEYDGTNFQVLSPVGSVASSKFGGTGADGALNVTSGTTTIDLGSSNFVVKNYTSINISGGATLAFSNPASGGTIIVLKSQGAVTIAGTLDASGTGTSGGTAVTGTSIAGIAGTAVASQLLLVTGGATGGVAGATGSGVAGGTAPTNTYFYLPSTNTLNLGMKTLIPGTGGGSGSVGATSGTSGAGGRGGAALMIECAGAWNFTGTINVSGITGGNAVTAGGGGGGGGAGTLLALYNSLTASSGTVTNNSGAGGTGAGASNCGGGGGGASVLANGGNAGFNSGAPASPSNGGGGGGGGGFGGITGGSSSTSSSLSLITANSYFA